MFKFVHSNPHIKHDVAGVSFRFLDGKHYCMPFDAAARALRTNPNLPVERLYYHNGIGCLVQLDLHIRRGEVTGFTLSSLFNTPMVTVGY